MEFPATLRAFQEAFPDEAACWRHLRGARWPQGFRCPRCGHRRRHRLQARPLDQCACCRYQVSLTAGTVLHKIRVPLHTWFLAIFFVGRHKQGISALQLQRDAGIGSYRTAWLLLHKIRCVLGPAGELRAGRAHGGAGRAGGRAPHPAQALRSA